MTCSINRPVEANRRPRMLGVSGIGFAVALLLTGCDKYFRELETAGTKPIEAQKLHPIGAELSRAKLDVFGSTDLKRKDSDTYFAVVQFVREYRREGRGPLEVSAARRGSHDMTSIQSVIRANGIPASLVRFRDRSDGSGTITLAYERIAVVAPDECRHWNEDVTRRVETTPYPNFGCASQRNLANMVADPTDLIMAKPEDDRGSDRRTATYRLYKETGGAPVNASKVKE